MSTNPIYREQLQEAQRGPHAAKLFGIRFSLMVEPYTFDSAGALSEDYDGGYWDFFILSNGGFYMAPKRAGRLAPNCCAIVSTLRVNQALPGAW